MAIRCFGHTEFKVSRRLLGLAYAVSFILLPSYNADAGAPAQEPTLPRVVWIRPIDSTTGSYRVVLEVNPGMLDLASRAVGAVPLFLGDQPIIHSYNISGNLLYGFVRELPKSGDGVWFYRSAPGSLDEARAKYVASGETYLPIDIPALLSAGEERRKRITDVQIETRLDPGPPEMTIYIVKLEVENCTAETFTEPGFYATTYRPKVYVEEEPADSTIFSDEEELIVAEFSVMPEENGVITLRYPNWKLTAPEPFTLLGQE